MRPLFFDSMTSHSSASLSDFAAPINPVSLRPHGRGRGNLHGWLGEMPWIDSGRGQRHLRRKI
jgi:hypothetical protein